MKRSGLRILLGIAGLALASCGNAVPTPQPAQSRAIDQDIAATHVVGPTTTSPAKTEREPSPTMAPWRNEEVVDQQKAQQPDLLQRGSSSVSQ